MDSEDCIIVLSPKDRLKFKRAVIEVGSKWCGSCKVAGPKYKKIAAKYRAKNKGIGFYYVDIGKFDKVKSETKLINTIVDKTGVLPSFFFIRNDEIVAKMKGFDKKQFIENISKLE